MDEHEVRSSLREYVVRELLHGDGRELDWESPLLEWGVLSSMTMVALIDFVQQRFGVEIPNEDVVPQNFENLGAICRMVMNPKFRR